MRILSYPLLGLALAATAAHAQETSDTSALPAGPEAEAAAPADLPPSEPAAPADAVPPTNESLPPQAAPPAEPALPATDAPQAVGAEFSDEQVDQFAEATVKVQAIDADASIAAEEKQTQMAAAVTGTGLDPATYNEIGRALAIDPELRNRVQVAMTRHAGANPTEG